MDNTLESLLRYLDTSTGLDRLSTPYWLIIVMVAFLVATIFSELFEKQNDRRTLETRYRLRTVGLILTGLSTLFTLSAWCLSYYSGYYYNFYVVLGLLAQMTSSLVLSLTWSSLNKSKKTMLVEKALLHLNAITIIFVVSGRWLIRGVDAEETSADTLNIFYNGGFQYSMHAGWYDLAPIDSILKVILLWINGNNNPYSSYESFLISMFSGLTLYFMVYTVVKNSLFLDDIPPLIPALLAIHPYGFLPGAPITPTNIAVALALSSLLVFLFLQQKPSMSYLVISTTLFITSSLAHPFSLSVLIFTVTYLLAKYLSRSLRSLDLQFLLITSTLWLAKAVYTATIHGVASIWNSVINGILMLWERESVIAFRNVGYHGLPKLSLTSFSASLGIIGGLAVIASTHLIPRRHAKNFKWINYLILFFTGLTGSIGLFAAIGGQSRYILTPFASLLFSTILFYCKIRSASSIFKLLITLAAVLTVLSPNFIPDQYSLRMAAKITDDVMFKISKILFEELDTDYVVNDFQGNSDVKLYIDQKGEFARSLGEAGLIVEKIILHNVVRAKTHWDFAGRGPFYVNGEDYENFMDSVVLDSGLLRVISSRVNP